MENENYVSPAAPADSAPANSEQSSPPATSETPQGEAQKDPAPQPEAEAKPRARGAQQRIEQLVWQRQEAERKAAEYESRLAAYEREQQLSQQRAQLHAQRPRVQDFNDLDQYGEAIANWSSANAKAEAMAEWEQRQQEIAYRQAQQAQVVHTQMQQVQKENTVLSTNFQEAVKKYPDFMEKVNNPELPSIRGTPAYYAILESDKFGDISYALANNPAELERLASIADPIRATREIARLEAKFSGPSATSAPPPPPNRIGSAASGPKDYIQMGTAEHVKAYLGRRNRPRV